MAVVTEALPDAAAPAPAETRTLREWLGRLDVWVGLLVVAACCTFVFVQLQPGLLFRNTTPSGGDTAAHVWWPAYLRDHLLPWRVAGWSPDFYAGFPAGQYYFPLPALLIVALDVVLPYNVAFKLITALGPVLLPLGAYAFGRGLRAPRPAPAAFAVAATASLFIGETVDSTVAFNQHIAGGNLASTLAGEFSFTIALAFALAFLGTLAYSLRTGERHWLPAVLFAAAITSHLVVGIFIAFAGAVVWLAHRPLRNLGRAAAIAAVGGLLTAVWLLPLVATLGYTTDMRYEAITDYSTYLFPNYLWGVDGALPWEWGATVLVAIAIVAVVMRRGRNATATAVLISLTALCGLAFRFWEDLQSTTVWNLRLLPFWYLCVFLLMGLGVAEAIRGAGWLAAWYARRERTATPPSLVRAGAIALLIVVVAVGTLKAVNDDKNGGFLGGWINWNYRGYEDTSGGGATQPHKQYPEYRAVIDSLAALPPGRAMWEGNTQLNEYGSPLALMLLPYWTNGRISSMEGVYYEASATTPYHFMTIATLAAPGNASNAVRGVPYRDSSQFSLGVRWLQVLGVRYLVVHSPESKRLADADPRLRLVATSPDLDGKAPLGWSTYRVARSTLVEPLRFRPVVVDVFSDRARAACERRMATLLPESGPGKIHEWQDCIAVPWFNDPSALDRPLVAEGPASWQRAGPNAARSLVRKRLPSVRVSKIHTDDDSISFHVSRTGVPVYVKTSFFPNWQADGARGPYRATPNFMVVVPTSRNVTLKYGTTSAEWLGRLGTLAGVAGLSVLAFGPWWRRRRDRKHALPEGVPEAGV